MTDAARNPTPPQPARPAGAVDRPGLDLGAGLDLRELPHELSTERWEAEAAWWYGSRRVPSAAEVAAEVAAWEAARLVGPHALTPAEWPSADAPVEDVPVEAEDVAVEVDR